MLKFLRTLSLLFLVYLFSQPILFSQDMEMDDAEQVSDGTDFQRGIDAVAQQGDEENWDIFERWGVALFGQKSIDPLAGDAEAQQATEINEGTGERAEMAAEFTDAATTVATAGLPAPGGSAGATVAGGVQYAVGEGAETIAEDGASEEPGVLTQIYNWVCSWF